MQAAAKRRYTYSALGTWPGLILIHVYITSLLRSHLGLRPVSTSLIAHRVFHMSHILFRPKRSLHGLAALWLTQRQDKWPPQLQKMRYAVVPCASLDMGLALSSSVWSLCICAAVCTISLLYCVLLCLPMSVLLSVSAWSLPIYAAAVCAISFACCALCLPSARLACHWCVLLLFLPVSVSPTS